MAPESQTSRATAYGLAAIVAWGITTGLLRIIGESFGAALGTALYCTLGAGLLWIFRRPKSLRDLPAPYLWVTGALFVIYNVSFGLSLGFAKDANQALEVSIVNYLWPTLMVAFSVALPPWRKVGWTLIPGILLAVIGIGQVVSGDAGLNPSKIVENVSTYPLPYALGLCAAVSWGLYSVLAPRLAKGHDGITVFFTATAASAWLVYAAVGEAIPAAVDARAILALLAGAVLVSVGYACWNVGITHGNLTLLASASYATPILASGSGALLLGATLGWAFWQGVALVTVGSLLSWWATRRN